MKKVVMLMMSAMAATTFVGVANAQGNEERMTRDIEVAENILSTLIKQQYERKYFFTMDIKGNYMSGYGVTFRLPGDFSVPLLLGRESAVIFSDDNPGVRAYSVGPDEMRTPKADAERLREVKTDSVRDAYYQRLVDISRTFLADYGDLLSQLTPSERIVITNRGAGERFWFGGRTKRTFFSVEAVKSDITDYRTGKISRDQMMKKINVVNAESDDELAPDLELLSSIFNRLYREDLSNTFFGSESVFYERLRDYGVIYYMKVFSSREQGENRHSIPTLRIDNLSREERDAKVIELYPKFEKDMKENMLEYGRTVKSLKPEEVLVFNIEMTACKGCDIPSTLELSVKSSVLNEYSTGKLTKDAALAKVAVKKGPLQ